MPDITVEEVRALAASDTHWDFFVAFSKNEIAAGGPDPHMQLVVHMSRHEDLMEQLWRAGVYVGVYNVPTAEIIWEAWPWPRIMTEPIEPWLRANWKGIATRRERRAVRSVEKMTANLTSYAAWLSGWLEPRIGRGATYKQAWEAVDKQIKYTGRYAAFKLLEVLRRMGMPFELPDMRPRGGWSPRATLAMLYPERAEAILGKDTQENIAIIDATCLEMIATLKRDYQLSLDLYLLEVLLCDYRQAYVGQRQYPGRSQDSELEYRRKTTAYWGELPTKMFAARKELFPHEVLGEIQGWPEVRKELGQVLRGHGYTWSDLRFDYVASKGDLSRPVAR